MVQRVLQLQTAVEANPRGIPALHHGAVPVGSVAEPCREQRPISFTFRSLQRTLSLSLSAARSAHQLETRSTTYIFTGKIV